MSGMISSRSTKKTVEATRSGNGNSDVERGETGDGEGYGVGTRFSATLNERANKSLNRNAGPSRPSANDGMIATPNQSVRKTGRV